MIGASVRVGSVHRVNRVLELSDQIITAFVDPVTQPVTAGDTAADLLLASATDVANYIPPEGRTISSAVATYTVDGVSVAGTASLIGGEVVSASVLVTDSEGDFETFNTSTVTATGAVITVTTQPDADVVTSITEGDMFADILALLNQGVAVTSGVGDVTIQATITSTGGDPVVTNDEITNFGFTYTAPGADPVTINIAVSLIADEVVVAGPAPTLTDPVFDPVAENFSVSTNQAGTAYWLVSQSATVDEATLRAGAAGLSGTYAAEVGPNNDTLSFPSISAGDWYFHFGVANAEDTMSAIYTSAVFTAAEEVASSGTVDNQGDTYFHNNASLADTPYLHFEATFQKQLDGVRQYLFEFAGSSYLRIDDSNVLSLRLEDPNAVAYSATTSETITVADGPVTIVLDAALHATDPNLSTVSLLINGVAVTLPALTLVGNFDHNRSNLGVLARFNGGEASDLHLNAVSLSTDNQVSNLLDADAANGAAELNAGTQQGTATFTVNGTGFVDI